MHVERDIDFINVVLNKMRFVGNLFDNEHWKIRERKKKLYRNIKASYNKYKAFRIAAYCVCVS